MKTGILLACAVCLGLISVLRFAWYGFSVERAVLGCYFSEVEEKLPPGDYGRVIDASGMFEGIGADFNEQCGAMLRATRGQLADMDVEMEGKPIRRLPEGSTYRIVQKVAIYKEGADALITDRGPLRYYVVIDSNGARWYTWAGLNKEDYIRP